MMLLGETSGAVYFPADMEAESAISNWELTAGVISFQSLRVKNKQPSEVSNHG
jgi:hypothetical protein